MFRHVFQIAISCLIACTLFSCSSPGIAPPDQVKAQSGSQKQLAPVRHTPARTTTFHLRTFSTGTLAATARAEIKTARSGQIQSLPVKEGTFIKKGQLLARLDDTDIRLRLQQARLRLEEAEFNKNDLLIMQGGTWGVDTSVNQTTLLSIHQQSGYKKALQAIEQLEYELSQTKITAPFSGLVAELKAHAHQYLHAGETLCTLIDPLSYEAIFSLLEKEAVEVKTGQPVKISPLARPAQILHGRVSSINPVVDEHGLVRIHASIAEKDLRQNRRHNPLLDGMNLKITIEKAIPGQLVIPRSAVVLRSGKPVVFTYDAASGLAKWNYVSLAHENDSEVAIAEGLKAGDLVIYEGNLHLDHDAEVSVVVPGGEKTAN